MSWIVPFYLVLSALSRSSLGFTDFTNLWEFLLCIFESFFYESLRVLFFRLDLCNYWALFTFANKQISIKLLNSTSNMHSIYFLLIIPEYKLVRRYSSVDLITGWLVRLINTHRWRNDRGIRALSSGYTTVIVWLTPLTCCSKLH
jgi:hypothetical protein